MSQLNSCIKQAKTLVKTYRQIYKEDAPAHDISPHEWLEQKIVTLATFCYKQGHLDSKLTPSKMASMGGKARAAKLTKQQRVDIAKKAVAAREARKNKQ